jgi:hypothetical protein
MFLSPRFEQNIDLSAAEDGGQTLQFWFKLMYSIYLRKNCQFCCVSFTEGGTDTTDFFQKIQTAFQHITVICDFLISIKLSFFHENQSLS